MELGIDRGLGRGAIQRDHRRDDGREIGRVERAVLVGGGEDAGPDRFCKPEPVARAEP